MNGKNSKIIKITDINNKQFCLLNRYVQFYKKNLWQYLNFGGSSNDIQILHLNFFDYFNIDDLKILQYSKCINDDNLQNKGLLVYINHKFNHIICYINLFFNALTYYIIKYQRNLLLPYIDILKKNILCTTIRKFNKYKDYSMIYKNKQNKTLDKVYFKKSILNDIQNLNLNIKFCFSNLTCNYKIDKIFNFNNYPVYTLTNNNEELNVIFYLSKKHNSSCNYKIKKISVDNFKPNSNLKTFKRKSPFNGTLCDETLIIDLSNNSFDDVFISEPIYDELPPIINYDIINQSKDIIHPIENPNDKQLKEPINKQLEKPNEEQLEELNKELIEKPNEELIEKPNKELIEKPNEEQLEKPNEEQLEEHNEEQLEKSNEKQLEKSNEEQLEEHNEKLIENPNEEQLEKLNKELIEKTNEEQIKKSSIKEITEIKEQKEEIKEDELINKQLEEQNEKIEKILNEEEQNNSIREEQHKNNKKRFTIRPKLKFQTILNFKNNSKNRKPITKNPMLNDDDLDTFNEKEKSKEEIKEEVKEKQNEEQKEKIKEEVKEKHNEEQEEEIKEEVKEEHNEEEKEEKKYEDELFKTYNDIQIRITKKINDYFDNDMKDNKEEEKEINNKINWEDEIGEEEEKEYVYVKKEYKEEEKMNGLKEIIAELKAHKLKKKK